MNMRKTLIIPVLAAAVLLVSSFSFAEERLGIFPVKIHSSEKELIALGDAVEDILASRLSRNTALSLIDAGEIKRMIKVNERLDENSRLFSALNLSYAVGTDISYEVRRLTIILTVYDGKNKLQTQKYFFEISSLDDFIPKFSEFVENVKIRFKEGVFLTEVERERVKLARTVKRVKFKGIGVIREDALKGIISTKEKEQFDEAKIRKDISEIFKTGLFDDVSVDIINTTEGKDITFKMVEKGGSIYLALSQKKLTADAVDIAGNFKIEKESVLSMIPIKRGVPFDASQIKESIQKLYKTGFFEDIKVDFKETRKGNLLTFTVAEKPSIRSILIIGNKEIELDKIKDAIAVKERQIFDISKIKEDIKKIRKLYIDDGFLITDVAYKIDKIEHNQINLTYQITERKKVMVKKIIFIGNKVFDDDALKDAIVTREGGYFSWFTQEGIFKEEYLEGDVAYLINHYLNNGYVNFKVSSPMVQLSPDKKWIYITFKMEEGEQFKVGALDVSGSLAGYKKEEILKKLTFKTSETFNKEELTKTVEELTDFYGDDGYAYANIMPQTQIDNEKKIVNITFNIQTGKKVYIEKIIISGNTSTRDRVIRREVRVAEGELYNATKVKKSRNNIFSLGFFEDATITTAKGSSDDKVNLKVTVKERLTGSIAGGLGYSTSDGFVVFAQVSQNNFLGYGQRISLTASLGTKAVDFDLSITEPSLFDSKFGVGFDAFHTKRDYLSFKKLSKGIGVGGTYRFTDEFSMGINYKFEEVKIYDVLDTAAQVIKDAIGSSTTSSSTIFATFDKRDNRLDPSKGYVLSASATLAGSFLGGTNDFAKYIFYGKYYTPTPFQKGSVFSAAGTYGILQSLDNSDNLLLEKFFLGGLTSMRGFKARSLAPKDPVTGDIIGGNRELFFNFDYSFPLLKEIGIKGVLFADAGNAYNNTQSISFRYTAGFGIRWLSPFGPLRVEWGKVINPAAGESRSAVDFSMGTGF